MFDKVGWIGTVSSIIGSFAIAFGYTLPGYSFFLIGSISWLVVGVKRKDNALTVLNGVFLVANIIGFYRAFQ